MWPVANTRGARALVKPVQSCTGSLRRRASQSIGSVRKSSASSSSGCQGSSASVGTATRPWRSRKVITSLSGCLAAVILQSAQPAAAQPLIVQQQGGDACTTSDSIALDLTTCSHSRSRISVAAAPQPQASPPAAQPTAAVAEACPEREGLRKYICYGPCCAIPWGPGGPICLALSAASFRYAVPFTFSGWFSRSIAEADKEPEGAMRVDPAGLAFSVALFASAAPRQAAGAAYSFALLVLSLA
jgi:hypothetical protein